MARYKECDKCYHRYVCGGNTDKWSYYGECSHYINAADVAPKSEVERLKKENEKLTINMNAYGLAAKRLAEEKSEVAREIFEEIEKKINMLENLHLEEINKEYIKDTPLYDRHSGIIFALQRLNDFIAELKKKYTEGNYENRNN